MLLANKIVNLEGALQIYFKTKTTIFSKLSKVFNFLKNETKQYPSRRNEIHNVTNLKYIVMQTELKNDFTIIFDRKDKNKKRGKQKSLLLILVKLHG